MDDDQARELRALERILSDPSVEPTMLSYGILKYITNSFSNEIGRGGFGVVYQGDLENWVVAVKISKTHNATDRQFLDEIRCLKIANHKNIVRFLGYCSDIQEEVRTYDGVPVLAGHYKRLLCFEYVPKGNIRQYLQQEKPHQEDWPARYKMIRGICQGLHYLHDKQIIHRDLKPENVMLDAQMEPKITDFGLSRFLDQGTSTLLTSRIAGTLRYIAPESKDNGEVSLKSDIYALGVIMVELLSGMSMISLLHQWDKYIDMSLPRVRGCTELARNCMDQDKHQRPTVREVIRDLDSLESMFPWSSISQSRPMGPESTVVKLPSRSLTIAWVDNPEYWRWTSRRDSRFGECAELLRVYYLKVSRLITPKDLPAATTSYTAYLVYKRAGSTLEGIVQTASTLHFDNIIASSKVSLHPKEGGPSSAHGVTYPVTRGDGWLELRLGEFSNEKAVTVQLLHEDPNKEMSGLIIDGMEVRRSL
ncbi:hypothetical protein CFC21_094830 [Triticum aestivum]|uniref:non-specific serine/threonine protein kinase n=2 Tax=Triticum aestivum TaxID=4565 RepID=A0A3B6QPS6_WHEAT|nr:hypothetical protein CFC21_094830 [Triticum aestivum]